MILKSVRLTAQILSASVIILMGSEALAWHEDQVRGLAHRSAAAAFRLSRTAQFEASQRRWRDEGTQNALMAFAELEEAARHYHREVESYCQDPRHTMMDFQRLSASYFQAQQVIGWGYFSAAVYQEFGGLSNLLQQLSLEYNVGRPEYPYPQQPWPPRPPPPPRHHRPRPFPYPEPGYPQPWPPHRPHR